MLLSKKRSKQTMTILEKQNGLAHIAYSRDLIDQKTYNAIIEAKASYDLLEMLYWLIEEPNIDKSIFVYRAAINSK